MAQTVALYRGEITVASGSVSTIFTNTSSGIATRLRIGWLSWATATSVTAPALRLTLYVAPVGLTYSTVIAATRSVATGTYRFGAAVPMVGNPSVDTVIYGQSFSGSDVNPASATYDYQNTSFNKIFYIQDTIIGPGDLIKVGWSESVSSTSAVISYCFSTITES
jgi:hypothetical protein